MSFGFLDPNNATTTVSYGPVGAPVFFSDATITHLSFRPELDSAKRTTKYVRIELRVRGIIACNFPFDVDTSAILLDMRRRLSRPGGALVLKGRGCDLAVNDGGGVKDVAWGPVPTLLDVSPLGRLAQKIEWQVTTCIPECSAARFEGWPVELCYSLADSHDADGYAQLSGKVRLEIPMSKGGDPTATHLPDHVDRYRDLLDVRVPPGYSLENHAFNVSDDKRVMEATWTFRQERSPPPPGCTKAPIKHTVRSAGPAWIKHLHTVQGTVNVPPNTPKEWAFLQFMRTAQQRFGAASAAAEAAAPPFFSGVADGMADVATTLMTGSAPAPTPVRPAVFEKEFKVTSGPTDRSVEVSYTYQMIRRGRLIDMVRLSGVWLPLAGANWVDWQRSMEAAGVNGVRGTANVVYGREADAIVDLCAPLRPHFELVATVLPASRTRSPKLGPPAAGGFAEVSSGFDTDRDLDPTAIRGNPLAIPAPEHTWLSWSSRLLYTEPRGRFARHRPMAGKMQEVRTVDAAGPARNLRQATGGGSVASATWTEKDILQEVGPPTGVLYLSGFAERIGHEIPRPQLLTLRGCVAKLNRVVKDTGNYVVQRWLGLPVWARDWMLEYYLDTPPKGPLPVLADPLLGIDGGQRR